MKPLDITEMQNSLFTEPVASAFTSTGHWTPLPENYLNEDESTLFMLKGSHLTEETKQKLRRANVGKKLSQETKTKISKNSPRIWLGKKFTLEHRASLSRAKLGKTRVITDNVILGYAKAAEKMRGRKRPEFSGDNCPSKRPEVRAKISRTLMGHAGANLGKHFSTETKRKIAQTRKKLFRTGELIPSMKGRHHSEETKKRMSENNSRPMLGKHLSLQTKEKIRAFRLNQIFPRKDSIPEKLMQEALVGKGLNFKTHVPLLGQPDIFIEPNVCVFVDGCYWHGCAMCDVGARNPNYNQVNIKDLEISEKLKNQDYVVLRFWEHDIENNLNQCISKILDKIK